MNSNHLYAFYGSLRKGMTNHRRYSKGMELVFTEFLTGYRLHAMRWYPYAVRTGNPDDYMLVEVYRLTDKATEQAIHDLELSVGYHYDEVLLRDQSVGIYLFRESGAEPSVKGGDWVKFFGSP